MFTRRASKPDSEVLLIEDIDFPINKEMLFKAVLKTPLPTAEARKTPCAVRIFA
tara:strand:+ start:163 stop:324 length:162 start_codon:yes stop_codon:yes gene_type:complete